MREEVFGIIYVIENTVNGKQYVGQTRQNMEMRWAQHASRSRTRNHAISSAIRKYGRGSFVHRVLGTADSQEKLDALERLWISQLNTIAPCGYNLASGGNAGNRHSPESKEKISKANKGRVLSEKQKAHLSEIRTGTRTSEQTKEKIRKAMLGRTVSLETRHLMSKAQKGRIITPEARIKISAALRGLRRSIEHRAAISAAQAGNQHFLGHTHSEKSRKKMSKSRTGVKQSPEHRAHVASAVRAYWAAKKAAKTS